MSLDLQSLTVNRTMCSLPWIDDTPRVAPDYFAAQRGAERPPKGSPFRVPGSPLAERWHPALTAQRHVPHERSEWGTPELRGAGQGLFQNQIAIIPRPP